MRKTSKAAALAAAIAAAPGMALAGGYGCQTGECYERVKAPDVYANVSRPVVIEPGYTQVSHYPAAIMNRVRAVEVVPGSFSVSHQPALWGSYTRTVMVSPGQVVHSHVPATYKTIQVREIVRAAGVRWEYQRDSRGKLVKCKVETPAVTRTVTRTVLVSPARTVAHVKPARYAQVRMPMLVQPARLVQSYNPPAYRYINEPMVVRPATREVINHPPVIGFESRQVKVRSGGYTWAPVRHRHW